MLAAWCALVAPGVDLPAHGAQVRMLLGLLADDAALTPFFVARFTPGYALSWLLLPLAWALDGAGAVKVASWLALVATPLAHLHLLDVLKRPRWLAVVGLPLCFHVSYYYGFLPSMLGLPLALLAWALAATGRWLGLAACLALAGLLHLQVLGLACLGAVLLSPRPVRALLACLPGLALVAPLVATLLTGSTGPPAAESWWWHVGWFFRYARAEGLLGLVVPLASTALLASGAGRPAGPGARLTAALALLYLASPNAYGPDTFLLGIRLPVYVAFAATLVVPARPWPRGVALALGMASLAAVGEAALFHLRFARAMEGLTQVMALPAPGTLAVHLTEGRTLPFSQHPYLEHVGAWWLAARGGRGSHFFEDGRHHAVTRRPGTALPEADTVLVVGEGPTTVGDDWTPVLQVGRFRVLRRVR